MTTNMSDTTDLFDFDGATAYSAPEVKESFAAPVTMPTSLSTQPAMQGPSHQYDLYKQQTGLVPGAFESLTAANAMGYNPLQFPNNEIFAPTLNPSDIGFEDFSNFEAMAPAEPAPPVRFYPGMHQAAALEKAQRAKENNLLKSMSPSNIHSSPSSSSSSTDSKVSFVMPTMSARPSMDAGVLSMGSSLGSKPKKDEEDMDEDERLLASEEGKKLSSKERRQLRNKVSARAFRSRRKEYITQLEAEISNKVTENNELRSSNQALADENRRLNDFTRMLLSSPAFSTFLNDMSAADPSAMAQMNAVPNMGAPVPTTRPMPIDISSRLPAVPFN